MKHVLDKDFKYTPVDDQGPDYLRRKFERIRRERDRLEREKREREQEQKVAQLPIHNQRRSS